MDVYVMPVLPVVCVENSKWNRMQPLQAHVILHPHFARGGGGGVILA